MVAARGAFLIFIAFAYLLHSSYGGAFLRSSDSFDSGVMSRWKRSPQKAGAKPKISTNKGKQQQSKGVRLENDCISPALEWVQSCCYVPFLVPKETEKKCLNGDGRVYSGLFHTIREAYMRPYWKGDKKIPKQDYATKAQYFVGNPAMFVNCVLKEMKMVGEDGRIDKPTMETVIQGKTKKKHLDNYWDSTALAAAQTCQQETEGLPIREYQTPQGKTTSLIPYAFMLCLQKKMFEGCKSYIESPGCGKAKNQLQACKLEEFWQQLQQGGPPAGSNTNMMNEDGDMNKNDSPSSQTPNQENPMPQEPQQTENEPPPEPEPAAEEAVPEAAAEEQQPAAEEAPPAEEPPAEEAQPAAEEEAPAEPPAEEPPAEEPAEE